MRKLANKKNTHIDMTPFVDIAFLILTFFILVTNFKSEETIKITPPNSVSTQELKEIPNSLTIFFDAGGNVFVSISKELREPFLKSFYEKYGVTFSLKAIKEFNKFGEINSSLASLAQFYSLPSEARKKNISGLDMSDENQDLYEVVNMINNISGNSATIYLKGDKVAKYSVYKKILNALVTNYIHSFNLVTISEPIPLGSPLGIKQSRFNKTNN